MFTQVATPSEPSETMFTAVAISSEASEAMFTAVATSSETSEMMFTAVDTSFRSASPNRDNRCSILEHMGNKSLPPAESISYEEQPSPPCRNSPNVSRHISLFYITFAPFYQGVSNYGIRYSNYPPGFPHPGQNGLQ